MSFKPWQLGLPFVPYLAPPLEGGKVVSWIRHMRVDIADWYLLEGSASSVRAYVQRGGDPAKAVMNFCLDDDALETLWNNEALLRRIAVMKENGIKYAIAPLFSPLLTMPVALQLWQVYRTLTVTADLSRGGVQIIPVPHPCLALLGYPNSEGYGWARKPCGRCKVCREANPLFCTEGEPFERKMPMYVYDANHNEESATQIALERAAIDRAEAVAVPGCRVWVYGSSKRQVFRVMAKLGPERCVWVPTIATSMNAFHRAKQRLLTTR